MNDFDSLQLRHRMTKILLLSVPLIEILRLATHYNFFIAGVYRYNWLVDILITVLVGIIVIVIYLYIISLRKRIENIRYAKINQIDMISQLAAGMAHEIRNPLTSIKGFVQLIKQREDNEYKQEYLEVIKGEIKRIEDIISETLLLAQPKESKLEFFEIGELISSIINDLQDFARAAGVELILEFERETISISGDKEKLTIALLNFLRNGIEAIPHGGVVRINVYEADEDQVGVEIQDSGIGMNPEVLERVGTPFYTTKDHGKGLGMMVAFQMIHNHGGHVGIETKPGSGTLVTITLPGRKVI
ncbi:MAG: ATP-binding protein [Clostridia bacterium]|nr:ATP-binding protein [Clostridia bacterium]